MELLHLMNIPFWLAVSIMIYLIGILFASIRFSYPIVRWTAVISYIIFGAAYRIDIAIPVGLGVSVVFLLLTIIMEAFKKSKKRFTVAVLLGTLGGFLIWLIFFH